METVKTAFAALALVTLVFSFTAFAQQPGSPGFCGNGICEAGFGEESINCGVDCATAPSSCSDKICSPAETESCPADCSTPLRGESPAGGQEGFAPPDDALHFLIYGIAFGPIAIGILLIALMSAAGFAYSPMNGAARKRK